MLSNCKVSTSEAISADKDNFIPANIEARGWVLNQTIFVDRLHQK